MRAPFSSHPGQNLLLVVFLMLDILKRVKWDLSVVLTCISFMARGGKHCFMYFFSFEKVLFSSVAYLFIGFLILGEFIFLSPLYILVISPLCNAYLANIFSYSVGSLFSLETISFVVQKLFNFM
jgi:hypothetical protein